jgi:phosphatidylserine/phosphatidylglycerophosphate/cardiolipin synthase-like enzyme
MKLARSEYRFPWRSGNRFELLVDGPRFFERMLGAIDGAERYVLLELYLAESGAVADRFIAAFSRAAARGAAVRVLLDDFGARTFVSHDRERLERGGAEIAFYNVMGYAKQLRNLLRDHRKLLVVDGVTAFVGGAGLTDAFWPEPPRPAWRETMLQIEGPVVGDWEQLFAEVWTRFARRRLALPPAIRPPGTEGQRGRVVASRGLHHHEISRSVHQRIADARRRVWISTAYFVPSWNLRRALQRAARRGVDVRLLLPGPVTDHPTVRHAGRRYFGRLLRDGVRIFEFQPRFLHAKTVLCDEWASIGSSNLDRWTPRWNLDANQEVDDARFAREIEAMLEDDFRQSVELDLARWRRRSWGSRVLESVGGAVDRWLAALRFSRRR